MVAASREPAASSSNTTATLKKCEEAVQDPLCFVLELCTVEQQLIIQLFQKDKSTCWEIKVKEVINDYEKAILRGI